MPTGWRSRPCWPALPTTSRGCCSASWIPPPPVRRGSRSARPAHLTGRCGPIRDALADLRPGRSSRLRRLLQHAASGDGSDHEAIQKILEHANEELARIPAIIAAKQGIQQRLDEIAGAGYAQRVDLAFADPVLEHVARSIRVLAGDQHPLELRENGLGYNNVLYVATLLAELAALTGAPRQDRLHLLLVEEPEAHLHPQLQDLLMRFLMKEAARQPNLQVIATTHSPNFAAAAGVEPVTVLARPARHGQVTARALGRFGLSRDELGHLRRFLDVTKARRRQGSGQARRGRPGSGWQRAAPALPDHHHARLRQDPVVHAYPHEPGGLQAW
ncbi:MAG TPA: AAA family ATPase [Gemmataceae bacterium]